MSAQVFPCSWHGQTQSHTAWQPHPGREVYSAASYLCAGSGENEDNTEQKPGV